MFSWMRKMMGGRPDAEPPKDRTAGTRRPPTFVPGERGARQVQEPPPMHPENPGEACRFRIRLERDGETEAFDLVEMLAEALVAYDFLVDVGGDWLVERESGLSLRPSFVSFDDSGANHVMTCTTIDISHPDLLEGSFFEYQHSGGDAVRPALNSGFDVWVRSDFQALLDATRSRPEEHMMFEIPFDGPETPVGAPVRRVIFGPVVRMCTAPREPETCPVDGEDSDEHPFCPCCLLTHGFDVFKPLIMSRSFLAIRLFAAREEGGESTADCRINGEDFEPGAEALRRYAATWEDAGYEFRKQYVIAMTAPRLLPNDE